MTHWRCRYVECVASNEDYDYACHLVTSVTLVSSFQYITLAVVFSKGAPYRKPIHTNCESHLLSNTLRKNVFSVLWVKFFVAADVFLVNLLITLAATLWMTLYPMQWVESLMEVTAA